MTQNQNEQVKSGAEERQWTRRFWTLIAVLQGLRVILLILSPLDLSGDEAYYWEWGRHLDWGYFSKPPLIGWLMGWIGWIGADTTLGIRLCALLLGTGTLIWAFLLARKMFSARAGFLAAAAIGLSPANAALCQILTIDAPLLCSWTLALYATWQLFSGKRWNWGWAGLLTLAIGIGILSKQMMLVFPALATVFLVIDREYRHWLKHPGWWLVVCGSLLFLLPPLLWNYSHDWITFQHTASHFNTGTVTLSKQIGRFFEFLGSQLGLLGPVILPLVLATLWLIGKSWSKTTSAERFLFVFSAPALAVFVLLAIRQRVLPNWPAVYYPAGFLLLGAWIDDRLTISQLHKSPSRVFKWGIGTGAVTMLLLYAIMLFSPLFPFSKDPMERVRGWSTYGKSIAQAQNRYLADKPHLLIVTGHRYYTSQLAFYHPERPTVFRWHPEASVESQYEIWDGAGSTPVSTALIIVPGGREMIPPDLQKTMSTLRFLEEIEVPITPATHRTFALYSGQRAIPDKS